MTETQAEALKIAGLNTRIQNLLTRIDEMKDDDQVSLFYHHMGNLIDDVFIYRLLLLTRR